MKRCQYFGRGCTCVAAGIMLVAAGSLVPGPRGEAMVPVLLLSLALFYPGFTMIGMAIWPD
ncbi:MAG: hypothetical protein LW816_01810 [Planctomyces sp.]|jgi:hypothetical protein|nr:hypothetical protein [Planctomyces sp.]